MIATTAPITFADERDSLVWNTQVKALAIAGGDKSFRRCIEYSAKSFFTTVTRGGERRAVKQALGRVAKSSPVGLTEIDKRTSESWRRNGVEDVDDDGKVIGVELDGGGPGE